MILLSQEEVVLKVSALTGEFEVPITEERRESRLSAAAPGTMSQMEEEAEVPREHLPEPNYGYPGADYCGSLEQELGLETREEFRRLQDYLAHFHQSPAPVSRNFLAIVFRLYRVGAMSTGRCGVF